jgi:hypothetical protein
MTATRKRSGSFPIFDPKDRFYNINVAKSPDREEFDSLMSNGSMMQIIFSCETELPFIDPAGFQKICGFSIDNNTDGIAAFELMVQDYREQICSNDTQNPIDGLTEFCQRINEVCHDAKQSHNITTIEHNRKTLKPPPSASFQEREDSRSSNIILSQTFEKNSRSL